MHVLRRTQTISWDRLRDVTLVFLSPSPANQAAGAQTKTADSSFLPSAVCVYACLLLNGKVDFHTVFKGLPDRPNDVAVGVVQAHGSACYHVSEHGLFCIG